ncbi:DUF2946 domain-containing protein [Caballeronia sp. Lep1P3]|uniref:DUF2946 domain-containing protein n=1 Tax=Caballeronia sp. Lep1P3 TaxID=2878150 RepID=UPI001FD62A64|nr:DUF2946 domain-containing protein [Caballeronia sp. Lep1P3]
MHRLRRGIIGKTGSIAALCAMLLLSLAPVVSRLLAPQNVDAWLVATCASVPQATHASGDTHLHTSARLDACGYCDLAAHTPTPPIVSHAPPAFGFARDSFVAADVASAPRRPLFGDARPRAPPAFA